MKSTKQLLSAIPLGRLEILDPRQVWPSEEQHFAKYVAENIDELSRAVGIPLEVRKMEKDVGGLELDIFAVSNGDEGELPVVIELQLGESNHKHLGQIVAYSAGLESKIVIWIVTWVRDCHRIAVEWLNHISQGTVSFFLVRVETVRIENSPAAAQFIVETGPSEFARTMEQLKARTAYAIPVRLVWEDTPTAVAVSSWKGVYRLVLERAAGENIDLLNIPTVKATTNRQIANQFYGRIELRAGNNQTFWVEGHMDATATRRKIVNVLRAMQKHLSILCDDGRSLRLPL